MNANSIESLEWDSQFFGYPVAKVFINQIEKVELNHIFEQLSERNIRLTYLFVPPDNKDINDLIIRKNGNLVDQKIIFSKSPEQHSKKSNRIFNLPIGFTNEKLIKLALDSGKYSRFSIDKKFKNEEFERLYTEWLNRSIRKEIAFTTLVAKKKAEIIGLTTLCKNSNYSELGLVSVDENFRGQGIGIDLIQTADNIAYEKEFKSIKVATQLKNIPACKLYKKCNFRIEKIINIYHYWL